MDDKLRITNPAYPACLPAGRRQVSRLKVKGYLTCCHFEAPNRSRGGEIYNSMKNLCFKKRAFLFLSGVLFLLTFISPVQVYGAGDAGAGPRSVVDNLKTAGNAAKYDTTKENVTDYAALVGKIIGAFFSVLGMIFLGYIVYGGWIWMSARGEEQKIVEAKTIMRNAVIGLIILVGSYAITYFMLTALQGFNSEV